MEEKRTEIGQWYGTNIEELPKYQLLELIKFLIKENEELKRNI
jgi:hypothetical protein